jgi:single-stranded DNA-binding protein
MNHCSFFGKVHHITYGSQQPDTVEYVNITLAVENKRKSNSDFKKIDCEYLDFQAWGSAALILSSLRPGDNLLVIDSTARNWGEYKIYFRINEFKIIK